MILHQSPLFIPITMDIKSHDIELQGQEEAAITE